MSGTHVQNVNVVGVFIALSISDWETVEVLEVEPPPPPVQPDKSSAVVSTLAPIATATFRVLFVFICLSFF